MTAELLYVGPIIESDDRLSAQLKRGGGGGKVINRDCVNHLTYRRQHHIYIISNAFVRYDNISELIRKFSPTSNVLEPPNKGVIIYQQVVSLTCQ